MNKTIKLTIFVLAICLGLGAGMSVRQARKSFAPASAGSGAIADSAHGRRLDGAGRADATADMSLAGRLEGELRVSNGVRGWLFWFAALEQASIDDFPHLTAMAQGRRGGVQLVAQRWLEVSPRSLFDYLKLHLGEATAHGLRAMLLDEWPKKDPDAAIAALNEAGVPKAWRMEVASQLCNTDVERGFQLLNDWQIDHYQPSMQGVKKWAGKDPRHAAEFMRAQPAGIATDAAFETIGQVWAGQDPQAALDFATRNHGQISDKLENAIMKAWAAKNLTAASQWLSEASTTTQSQLSPLLVESWAKSDAGAALQWCQENLQGATLDQAIGGVVKGVADKDVTAAAALVAGMSPSNSRAFAARQVARKWFPDTFNSPGPVAPAALDWLNQLDSESRKQVVEEVHWQWSSVDAKSMAQFLVDHPEDEAPSYVYGGLAREFAAHDPAGGLDWAAKLTGSGAKEAGSSIYTSWISSQPEAAFEWLRKLPPGDARRDSFFQAAIRNLAASDRLPEQLPLLKPEEREKAVTIVQGMPALPADKRDRFLRASTGK